MDLNDFFSNLSSTSSRASSSHCNQDLLKEARELAHRGLKLFPVSVAAKLNGCPNEYISEATNNVLFLEAISASTQPLWGYRLALGPSGLCALILEGAVGRASIASLAPDLEDCLTLQARCGDTVYAFFWQPCGMKRIVSARRLAPGVSILGTGESCIAPPSGGAAWTNPGAEIEVLPYVLRELLAFENPDNPPGRAMPAPKPSPRLEPCRHTARFPQPLRKGYPAYNHAGWRGGYRICRQR